MAYWAVARIRPRWAAFVVNRLQADGFALFAPETKTGLLFPGYLFVQIVDFWQPVDRTLGVLGLIKCGDIPSKCPDAEIAKLQSWVGADGLVRLPDRPPPLRRKIPIGAKVRIMPGGFVGLYAGMSANARERVLIDLLGRQFEVKLKPHQSLVLAANSR
jgi:transcription antitermination factor NusG